MTIAALIAALVALIAARCWSLPATEFTSAGTASTTADTRERTVADYAGLLDAIARQVRSGSSLTTATIEEIDRSSPLGDVVDRLAAGGSLSQALAAVDPQEPDLALTVQALSATAHLGGPVAATLDEAAAVLRERVAARAERKAHSSQARLSARVLTIVPVAFAVWSAVASHQTRDVYVSTAAGGVSALCRPCLERCWVGDG